MKYLRNSLLVFSLFIIIQGYAQSFPGGFMENGMDTVVRARLDSSQIAAFMPPRGLFTFPAPYNTQGVRITNAGDCQGSDCVSYIGYSYWSNTNNHVGCDTMLIFVGLDKSKGGTGPTLFSYNKTTDMVRNLGPLFDASSAFSWNSGEGWYFSATLPSKLYIMGETALIRYDVITHAFDTVFDVGNFLGSGKYIWQCHSSNNDRMHSFALRDDATYAYLGSGVYDELLDSMYYFPAIGDYDECQVDKSGKWLLIKENVDSLYGEDNVIINLETGEQRVLLDQDGAGGHSDNGYGYMVAADNWGVVGDTKLWRFSDHHFKWTRVMRGRNWSDFTGSGYASWHLSFADAKDTLEVPVNKQYVVASAASENGCPRCDEITAFRLDTTLDVLVIAPTMTNYHKTGGSGDTLPGYSKMPKGNVDITGKYFIWSSNIGSNRLDVFIAKIPSQLLVPDSVLTSVTQLEEKNDTVKIFPNPANENLTIETSQKSYIEILSIEGQLIKTINTSRNKTNIDVSSFPSGVYVVEVKTEKGVEVKKFVKE
ncbi:MAG: T9SS type A sorting domain-containing protein [Bacteroidales bacterium]|jgi:hypothetical protein